MNSLQQLLTAQELHKAKRVTNTNMNKGGYPGVPPLADDLILKEEESLFFEGDIVISAVNSICACTAINRISRFLKTDKLVEEREHVLRGAEVREWRMETSKMHF